MEPGRKKPTTIDEYIASFPAEIQSILQAVRSTIQRAAPEAVEKIAYDMPTFSLKRDLVHFEKPSRTTSDCFPPIRDPGPRETDPPLSRGQGKP